VSQIKVENLTLGYENKAVVSDLNFSVDWSDYLCIVGENGSGKSTLIKALLGLVKPICGTITHENGMKNRIGYLPQTTAVQMDFPATVNEVIMSGLAAKVRFFYSKSDRQKAKEIMEKLGIKDLGEKCFRELSGGQRQRVLLARALLATGDILLLDEPTTGLDPNATHEMYQLIKKLNGEGITVIMVSHDVTAAVKFGNKILHLSHDSVYFGDTADYVKSPLGSDYLKGGKL
jgi:zinc transport system ATP-binding protein